MVDWDVHPGNGTQTIFYDDPSVLTISVHENRMFPADTGGSEARGARGARRTKRRGEWPRSRSVQCVPPAKAPVFKNRCESTVSRFGFVKRSTRQD